MNTKNKTQEQIRNILAVIMVIMIAAVCKVTSSFSVNLILSLFIFMLFIPLCTAMEKVKIPSTIATVISIILMILFIFGIVSFAVYAVDVIIKQLPAYASKLSNVDALIVSILGRWIEFPEDFALFDLIQIDWLNGVILPTLRSVSGSAINISKTMFVTIIMSVFLLVERNTIVPKIVEATSPEKKTKVSSMFGRIYHQVAKYIALKTVLSLATAVLFYIIGKIVKLDFTSIIAVLAFILNFIPTFGSIIVTALAIFIAFLQFFPVMPPVIFVAVGTIMTQMVIGNIIDPRLSGSQMNLSSFVILCFLSVFGYIWGIVGTFLAVPILSVIEIILANMEGTKSIAMLLASGRTSGIRPKKIKTVLEDSEKFEDILMPDSDK